jgi:hypothetical protein
MGFPFDLNAFIDFPGSLNPRVVEKAMLRGLFGARATHFALWGEAHEVKPGANRKALVEGEPNEGIHFLGRALCHILVMACGVEVFRRLRLRMSEIMCRVLKGFRTLM